MYGDWLLQLIIFIDFNQCTSNCNTSTTLFRWFRIDQLNSNDLFGPEPLIFISRFKTGPRCREFSIERELKPGSSRWKLIQSLEYNETDIANLFTEFILYTYPSMYMSLTLFEEFMKNSKFDFELKSNVYTPNRLYNSFCVVNGSFVMFKDFLLNMVALERDCPHGDIGGEIRTRCIFRFYCKAGADSLEFDELVQIFEDILAASKQRKGNEESPKQSAENVWKLGNLGKEDGLSCEEFVKMVGKLEIRGTARLYRSTQSPLRQMRNKKEIPKLIVRQANLEKLLLTKKIPNHGISENLCIQCSPKNYILGNQSIILKSKKCEINYIQEFAHQMKTEKLSSIEIIKPNSTINELRFTLRRFSSAMYGFPKSDGQKNPKWEKKQDRLMLVDNILNVCNNVREMALKMPRVVHCSSPIYVFGDVHGNFKDLMIYDHLFWRIAPIGCVNNLLFLGDYVDRGDHSVECVIYLFCMMLLLPGKVVLLRGNHEIRHIQQQFTFQRECMDKFGNAIGSQLWEAFNVVFDCFPVCAVIDEQIFASHGGIPSTTIRLESLYDIPVPMPNPMECKVAWEMLWNDPVDNDEYKLFLSLYPSKDNFPMCPHGYSPNMKRGTAFYYSEEAVDFFSNINEIATIIRAHEVMPLGYQYMMDGKVTTIFSCSNYCGATNESAAMYIECGKIRIIAIESNEDFQFS
ncbi:hypothetical protein RDWZM_003973 [Blomia tropicalis]|uniref:Serine/threonine-protein phosphatase n=1 Tax=Blomia tropicalis TaxID=40697 RepID=A0A9Q0RRD2_BLOTA|nr:hypothetical protein RDWZM_003973 [Blomia tropicalis]